MKFWYFYNSNACCVKTTMLVANGVCLDSFHCICICCVYIKWDIGKNVLVWCCLFIWEYSYQKQGFV